MLYLGSSIRAYPSGNILFPFYNNITTFRYSMIIHDDYLGFITKDNQNNNISYYVFDGASIIEFRLVCSTPSSKSHLSVSELRNINLSNSQLVILFTDDRDGSYVNEVYAQNLLFGVLNRNENSFNNVLIYPNPCSSEVNVQSDKILDKVELFSITGQLEYSSSSISKIDISNLSVGVYYLKITIDNEIYY